MTTPPFDDRDGTIHEIQPVVSVDEHVYEVGKLTSALAEAYTRLVRDPDPRGGGSPVRG